MITSNMLYKIHRRLCEIFISDDYFGGKCILFVGDALQLRPCNGPYIFLKPEKDEKSEALYDSEDLWKKFDVAVLEKNQRQTEENFWADMLNRFRVGEKLKEDLEILETRRLKNFPNLNTDDARHAFWTNKEVETHNMKILRTLPTDSVKIKAKTQFPRGYLPEITDYGTIDKTNFKEILEIKIQSNVMLIANLDIGDSLVNGALGIVSDIVKDEKGQVRAIMVEFANPDAGMECRRNSEYFIKNFNVKAKGVPIFRHQLEYNIKRRKGRGKAHGVTAKITQFPLRLADACTAHKLQGTTNEKGRKFVVHGRKGMPNAMAYVMLSRVANFEDLYIDEEFHHEMIKPSDKAIEENENMIARSITSRIREQKFDCLVLNINRLIPHLKDLEEDIYAQRSELIGVVETWIDPSNPPLLSSPLGTFYGSSVGNGKGVGAFLPKIEKTPITITQEDFQIISIQVKRCLQLHVMYLSSNCNLGNVVNAIDLILQRDGFHCFAGDFNFQSEEKNIVSDFFERRGYLQKVDSPTHEKGRTIDHIYVHCDINDSIQFQLYYPYYSDHAALLIKFDLE